MDKIERLNKIRDRLQHWKNTGESPASVDTVWHDVAFLVQILNEPKSELSLDETLAVERGRTAMLESRLESIRRITQTYVEHMSSLIEVDQRLSKVNFPPGHTGGDRS